MLRAMLSALSLSVLLIVGGCEYSLEAPTTDADVQVDRTVEATHAYYADMRRGAVTARRQASKLSDTISFARMSLALDQFRTNPPADDAFQSLDQDVRALITAHRGTSIGPSLAATVSNSMLMLLVRPDAQRALSDEERLELIAYYVRASIENYGMFFDRQIRALEALGPDHASAVKALAQQALSNMEGFKAGLRWPIEIPAWMPASGSARASLTHGRSASKC